MITVEALTAAIEEAGNWNLPHELAERLLPFIERHIAAGKQGITAEWVKGYIASDTAPENLQAVDDAFSEWAALNPAVTPKPTGEVPLPETKHVEEDGAGGTVGWYTGVQLIRYGDAREAAGRAGAVPDGWGRIPESITETDAPPHYIPREKQAYAAGYNWCVAAAQTTTIPAPIPQQPAAEGLAQCASAGNPVPRIAGATISGCVDVASQAEGAGAEVVGEMDLTAPPKVRLQIDPNGDSGDRSEPIPRHVWGDLTWCYESIGGQEVVYVRQDLVNPAPAADAGGVTIDELAMEWLGKARDVERKTRAEDQRVANWPIAYAVMQTLKSCAAELRRLTPEVRHGE